MISNVTRLVSASLIALLAGSLAAQPPASTAPKRKKILCIGQTKGFQHDATSEAMAHILRMGKETGLWDTYIKTDTQLITKKTLTGNAKNLDYFDAVFLHDG